MLALGAGAMGGAMNALAGGGTFATLPALIAVGLPANRANATSNLALLPGAAASALEFHDELGPIGGLSVRVLSAITFGGGLIGSLLLVLTPTKAFDFIIPWLLLVGLLAMLLGTRASGWLHERVTIGRPTLVCAQSLLSVYGGYFGGGVGLMTTAIYGLLASAHPRSLFAMRTLMLAVANLAAGMIFILTGLIEWSACIPMLMGSIVGGWLGARLGRKLPPKYVRAWTVLVTAATTAVFFLRAYS